MMEGKMCGCPHHKIVPVLIVLIGLTFLLQNYGVVSASFAAVAWPVLLILIGLNKMMKGMCSCCKM